MDINYYKKYEPVFGSWYITELIGEGTFGKVFKIEKTDFGETYQSALKVITIPQNKSEVKSMTTSGMDEDSVTTYFKSVVSNVANEFKLMSSMKGNSNIVSYEDHQVIEHEDGIGWDILIRMELLTPVDEHFKIRGFDKRELIKLGIDMCKALEVCQNKNVIHRDIKPENVFISDNGDYKLGDFGVAKKFEHTIGVTARKGTNSYMAPEVYKGESFGNSADIYSVGIVLYRYFNNNRTPFLPQGILTPDDLENALIKRISGESLPKPQNADEKLSEIILRACAYSPKERFASPKEMREELEKYLLNPLPPENTIIEKTITENPGISVKTATPIDNPEANIETKKDDKSKGKGKGKIAIIVAAVLLLIALGVGIVAFINNSNKKDVPTDTTTVTVDLSESNDPIENKIVEILMNDEYFMTDYLYVSDGTELYYTFLDLDFDGTNELIVNEHDSVSGYNFNSVLKFDLENNCYNHVFVNGGFDFEINGTEIKLFSNNKDGVNPYYIVENIWEYSSDNGEDLSVTLDLVKLFCAPGADAPSDIYSTNIYEVYLTNYSYEKSQAYKDSYLYYDEVKDKESTIKISDLNDFLKEKQNEFLKELSKTDSNLNLKYQIFNGREFNDLSKVDKEKVLRASYRAFDYDGKAKSTAINSMAESTTSEEKVTETPLFIGLNKDLAFDYTTENIYQFIPPEDGYYLFKSDYYEYNIWCHLLYNGEIQKTDNTMGDDHTFYVAYYCKKDVPITLKVTDTPLDIVPVEQPDSINIQVSKISKSYADGVDKYNEYKNNGIYISSTEKLYLYNEMNTYVTFNESSERYPIAFDIRDDGTLLLGFSMIVDGSEETIVWYDPQDSSQHETSTTKQIKYERGSVQNGEYVNEWADLRIPIPAGYSVDSEEKTSYLESDIADVGVSISKDGESYNQLIVTFVDCPNESAKEFAIAEKNYQSGAGLICSDVELKPISGYAYHTWSTKYTTPDDIEVISTAYIRKVDDKIIILTVYGNSGFTIKRF
ncbi:MAG: serine/threonine protein kinase [Clostridia bacterium]|nr:serine/threonine protein kinase [Clostridia bacterium]